jgi:hypothetical protein
MPCALGWTWPDASGIEYNKSVPIWPKLKLPVRIAFAKMQSPDYPHDQFQTNSTLNSNCGGE